MRPVRRSRGDRQAARHAASGPVPAVGEDRRDSARCSRAWAGVNDGTLLAVLLLGALVLSLHEAFGYSASVPSGVGLVGAVAFAVRASSKGQPATVAGAMTVAIGVFLGLLAWAVVVGASLAVDATA